MLAGTALAGRGRRVHLLAAANRDPRGGPTRTPFDVRREYKPNLGFGVGPHVCIGAPLARLEMKAAIETLLRIAPEYHLRDLDYAGAFLIRGPERGMIELAARGA